MPSLTPRCVFLGASGSSAVVVAFRVDAKSLPPNVGGSMAFLMRLFNLHIWEYLSMGARAVKMNRKYVQVADDEITM
jgi:hypothetical protein